MSIKKTLFALLFVGIFTAAHAQEPVRPDVSRMFDFDREAKINHLSNVSAEEAFNNLTSPEFMLNDDFLHKAVFKAFEFRKSDAIAIVVQTLRTAQHRAVKNTPETEDRLYISRKFLEIFPEDTTGTLLKLYGSADAPTRSRILYAAGNMPGQSIRELLVKALDDKTTFEKENPEIAGLPLRICDAAYNQLVIRYKIQNVLRTIGNDLTIQTRDYHINILKKHL